MDDDVAVTLYLEPLTAEVRRDHMVLVDGVLAHDDALADHQVCTDLEAMPAGLRGVHRDNPVNRCRGAGVQLELPPGVRGLTPRWATWAGPGLAPPTEAVVTALAEAARTWPAQGASRSVVQLAEPPEPDTRV